MVHVSRRVRAFLLTTTLALTGAIVSGPAAAGDPDVFVPSATVDGLTATFPVHQAQTPDGAIAWFVVVEASTSGAAEDWDVEAVGKLRNVGRAATMTGRLDRAVLQVAGTVDFSPDRVVQGTAGTGFPPTLAVPGSVADASYSPLVRLPDGAVLNAPQVANATGRHDKVVDLDLRAGTVTLALTEGFARRDAVKYLSTDASDQGAAALEGATWVPRLDAVPRAGDDSSASGRAGLVAFVNGPTGDPRTRQGINSALLGEGDPLNVLAWLPGQGRYSPMWDVHLTAWAPGERPRRVTRFADVEDLAEDGRVTAPGGSPWTASRVVVNCPIIAEG